MDLAQQPAQLLARVEARREAARKRRRLVPAGRLAQQEHVLLDRLAEDPQRGLGVRWRCCRVRRARGQVVQRARGRRELEEGRVAGGQVGGEQVGVELGDGGAAVGRAAVDGGAVLGDERAAEGDAGQVVAVDGDELLRGVGFQSCVGC